MNRLLDSEVKHDARFIDHQATREDIRRPAEMEQPHDE